MKAKLAGEISVVRKGSQAFVYIDGEEFPWWIARGSMQVNVDPNEFPSITLTILADHVKVDDEGPK